MTEPSKLPEKLEDALSELWNAVFDYALDKRDPEWRDLMADDRSPEMDALLAAIHEHAEQARMEERVIAAALCDAKAKRWAELPPPIGEYAQGRVNSSEELASAIRARSNTEPKKEGT